jgi:hypothetical protein
MFFQFDPEDGKIRMAAESLSRICGEDPEKNVPQGKLHSEIVEHDGRLYFGTHLANYWASGKREYSGGHVLAYELGSLEKGEPVFTDFGIMKENYTCYSGIDVDRTRGYVYVQATRWWHPYDNGTVMFRYNADGTGKSVMCRVEGKNFYQFADSTGDLWFTSTEDPGLLYRLRGQDGKLWSYRNALPLRLNMVTGTEEPAGEYGRHFAWGDRLDEDRCVFSMANCGGLWIFDAAAARNNSPREAFRKIGFIGTHGFCALGGDKIYYIQSADPQWTQRYKAGDLHLKSITLDGSKKADYGRIIDTEGRTPWRLPSLAADDNGTVYSVGDWRLLRDQDGKLVESGTIRHNDKVPGTYFAEDMWRGLFFSVITAD